MCYWLYIYFAPTPPAEAAPPSTPGTVPKRLRGVKSRGGGEEVSSFEKVEGRTYVVKAEGPGLRGGLLGTAEVEDAWRGYAIAFGRRVAGDAAVGYAGVDVSGGRRGEAFGAGGG
jgi:hypothetical protein